MSQARPTRERGVRGEAVAARQLIFSAISLALLSPGAGAGATEVQVARFAAAIARARLHRFKRYMPAATTRLLSALRSQHAPQDRGAWCWDCVPVRIFIKGYKVGSLAAVNTHSRMYNLHLGNST